MLTAADTGLVQAQNLIVGANGLAAAGVGTAVDANFTTAFTSASSLTAANVAEIGTDIAASANTGQLELTTCVSIDQTSNPGDSTQTAVANCEAAGSPEMAAAVTQFTTKTQPGIASAAGSWGSLTSLVGVSSADPTDFPGGLFTVDNDVSLSSTATVTAKGKPILYTTSIKVSGAAATGFVLPSGFTLTFPNTFSVNTKLLADEIQQSQVANPPTAQAIGTATVVSPEIAALVPGSKGVDSTATVYAVATANLTQPEFELYLGQGIYAIGTLSGVSFPLTVTFGEPYVGGVQTALPLSSISMSFPVKSSPLQALSCNNLGMLTGTMTDAASALAPAFADTTDTGASAMSATATKVTDLCAPTAAASLRGVKTGHATFRVRLVGNGGTRFTSETLTLPSGVSTRGIKAKDVKVTGARLRSIKGKGRTIVVNFRSKTKSATIAIKGGLTANRKLLKQLTKKKPKPFPIKYTVKYAPTGAKAANSTVATVTIKKFS